MRGPAVEELVFEAMYTCPKQNDPQNFQAFLQRDMIVEVRQEVQAYYGHIDTPEAKYPGLDYCNPTHRLRLSRWPWHRRLFRVFDYLRLTPNEIASLTKWEGTKWAKERYEKEQDVIIRDTTADVWERRGEVEVDDEPEMPLQAFSRPASVESEEDGDDVIMDEAEEDSDEAEEEDSDEGDDHYESDDTMAVYRRLGLHASLRQAGELPAMEDDEWEQWFKNVVETGQLASIVWSVVRPTHVHTNHSPPPAHLFPQSMLNTARASRWHEIPDFLHDVLRCAMEVEDANVQADQDTRIPRDPAAEATSSEQISSHEWGGHGNHRRAYSQLRLPTSNSMRQPT